MLNPSSPVSPVSLGKKRPHQSESTTAAQQNQNQQTPAQRDVPAATSTPALTTTTTSSSSSFRNVSACNRCRLRKNRCDQRLPRCQSCEKAGVRCVGYDPITKREIPRSYVYFLEARVAYLEKLLMDNKVDYKEAVAFDEEEAVKVETGCEPVQKQIDGLEAVPAGGEVSTTSEKNNEKWVRLKREKEDTMGHQRPDRKAEGAQDADGNPDYEKEDNWRIQNLVSNIGMVSVQGTSDPRYLGSTSGISFARVVFAAVKSSVAGNVSERPSERLPHSATGTGGSTMRDSFFGLQTRPTMKCAAFPDRDLAEKLVNLYFEHANPQMPILHRGDFMELLDRTYSVEEKNRSSRSLYTLNIVFAIGAGIIFEDKSPSGEEDKDGRARSPSSSTSKRPKLSGHQYQPEEYHASAIIHLESFLVSSSASDGFGGLEELQAVLLLASFALLRPVAPGLWYIVGVAIRLAVDLGLHYEDGTGVDYVGEEGVDRPPLRGDNKPQPRIDTRERGRREWVRDLRRRLWWCVYSFDRLVGCCVGRPFGISDQAISTEFPSIFEDKYITKSGLVVPPEGAPSYKHAALHYFKLRVLQSEIQDVLQYQQARFARQRIPYTSNVFTRSDLPSPFLQGFDSFRSWRKDIHRRLTEWQECAPTTQDTGVRFPTEFLELNYWQAIIMLYQQSLTVPAELAGELDPAEDVSSPSFSNVEDADDEDDIYFKVAEAGQKVIRIYRQLHRVRLVNYTYLATHHIFMAGISFLYAIWHSPWVRSRLTLDEVDFTVLAATSVLGDLMHKCPPAEACRDAFERMSKATVQMSLSTTGFGSQVDLSRSHAGATASQTAGALFPGRARHYARQSMEQRHRANPYQSRRQTQTRQSRPLPRFDMNLGDLFNDNSAAPERSTSGSRKPTQSYPIRAEYPEASAQSFGPDQPQPHSQSYTQRTPSMEYYGNYENPVSPSQQQQPSYYYANSPQHSASPSSVVAANNPTQNQFPHTDHEDQSGISLDFLDFDSTGAEGHVPLGPDGNPDYNMMGMPSMGHGVGHSVGIDLGFGMTMDFQHDWSENANYDMLEGYFFGGSGAGPSGGG
ncbi:Fungal specific transcription factor [Aspergillus wentii]|nr:Fungal specific transcription factor [Aspergillus wentii]